MKRALLCKSIRGASHQRSGLECQDSMKKLELPKGVVILAAADGHGSATCPFSRSGANTAVNVFCKVMEDLWNAYRETPEQLLTYLNREGDTRVAQKIEQEWKRRILAAHTMQKRPVPLTDQGERDKDALYRQYGTTLLGLLLGPEFYFAFQVGDGDILHISADGVERVMAEERILGTETHSLSRPNAWQKAAAVTRRIPAEAAEPSLFWLSTDGFANSYRSGKEFNKACTGYLEALSEHGSQVVEENLESWLAETSAQGCGDDITLLMCYDYPDSAALPPDQPSPREEPSTPTETPPPPEPPKQTRKPRQRQKIEIDCEELLTLAEKENINACISAYTSLENCGFPAALSKKISRLVQKLQGLRFALEKHPDQAGEVERFFRYYVPEGIRLAVSYYEYQSAGIPDQVMKKLYAKITDSIDTLNGAVEKKLLDIYRFDAMDTSAKADALRQILEQDGYSKADTLLMK